MSHIEAIKQQLIALGFSQCSDERAMTLNLGWTGIDVFLYPTRAYVIAAHQSNRSSANRLDYCDDILGEVHFLIDMFA